MAMTCWARGPGAVLALVLMFVLHPFALVPALLPLLAVAAMLSGGVRWRVAAVVVLAATEAAVFTLAAPRVNEFKAIYAPMNVPDSRVVAEILSPRGVYMLLDNFTERLDTDVSNNAGGMGIPAPPRSFGLYRDGSRIAALPDGQPAAGHAPASLDAAPYALLDAPRVLVLGRRGRLPRGGGAGARGVAGHAGRTGTGAARMRCCTGWGPRRRRRRTRAWWSRRRIR